MTVFQERESGLFQLEGKRRVVCAVCVCLVAALYYLFCVSTLSVPMFTHADPGNYYKSFRFDEINPGLKDHYGFYNLLADAFLNGQVHLPLEPDPKMMSLPNPLDSAQNNGLRMHDMSLFGGKYYLYFGPVPALSLFIPARILGLGKLTEPYAVWLFAVGTLVCAAYILTRLVDILAVKISLRSYVLLLVTLAFCGPLAYLLRRPVVYEVALTAGVFFGSLGFASLLAGWRDGLPSKVCVAFSSVSWGLAVGCRPNNVILIVPLILVWFLCLRKRSETFSWKSLAGMFVSVGPIALIIAFLLAYNFARFGDFLQFGAKYQLSGDWQTERAFHANQFSLVNIPLNLTNAFLNAPVWKSFFPFVEGVRGAAGSEMVGRYFASEPIVGLAWSASPILLGVLLFIFYFRGSGTSFHTSHRALIFVTLTYTLLPMVFSFWLIPGITMRYLLDYTTGFSLLGCLGLAVATTVLSGKRKLALKFVLLMAAGCSLVVSLFLGFSGYYHLFKQASPKRFFAVASTFKWLEQLSSKVLPGTGRLELMDAIAPSGMALLQDRSVAMLIGPEPLFIRVASPAAMDLLVRFNVIPARGASSVRVSHGTWSAQISVDRTVISKEFSIPIKRGANLIKISPEGDPQGQTGPVCGITGLNFPQTSP